jgi:hypothetical protein
MELLEARARRNARINVVTMFGLLVVTVLLMLWRPGGLRGESWAAFDPMLFGALLSLGGGIFSVIYVPTNWRVITKLPVVLRVMAVVGAAGLVLLTPVALYLAARSVRAIF